jgi:hypothetical protein
MPELTLAKKQQMEAIKLLNDWSKWVITVETAAIAGIFAAAKGSSTIQEPSLLLRGFGVALILLLFGAVTSFIVSIFYASQLLFSLPDIAEQLPEAEEKSINLMSGKWMSAGVLIYEKRQFYCFVAGLILVALASAVFTIQNLLR